MPQARQARLPLALASLLAAITAVAAADHQSPERGLAEAERFREYRVYHLGRSFRGHELTAVTHGRDGLKRRRRFGFIYGDCEPAPCAPPYEVQDYAACSRNLANYDPDAAPRRAPPIRGAPVYRFGGRGRTFEGLEVYTGRTTVVVFAPSYRAARRVVRALRSADGRVGPEDPLPRPARGALAGRLRCSG